MSKRYNGLWLLASAALLGCTTAQPDPEMVPAAELRRQSDAHARALEAERQRADTAAAEATRLERRVESRDAELEANRRSRDELKLAVDLARARIGELIAELANVGSAQPSEVDAAAELLRRQRDENKRLRDELALWKARASGDAPPAPAPDGGGVRVRDLDLEVAVTTIDGEPHTRREFCEYLYRDLGTPGLLDLFANRQLVLREARRRGLTIDDVAVRVWVEEQIVDQVSRAGSEQAFDERLAETGYTREAWVARLHYQARPQLLLIKLVLLERTTPEGREAFESRVQEVYERDYSERVTARHFFVACPSAGAEPAEVEEARRKAELALAAIRGGRPFAEVAQRSEDPNSKRLGGSLGTFDRTRFKSEQALNTAFFTATPGAPTGPVRSSVGFHVLLVDERKPPTRPFDAATRAIIIRSIEKEPPSDLELVDLVKRIRRNSHIVHSLSFD